MAHPPHFTSQMVASLHTIMPANNFLGCRRECLQILYNTAGMINLGRVLLNKPSRQKGGQILYTTNNEQQKRIRADDHCIERMLPEQHNLESILFRRALRCVRACVRGGFVVVLHYRTENNRYYATVYRLYR